MWLDISGLVISLAIILISCELFTNGIEWLGKELKLGDGVIGSIFSAVGTCLPETMIPVIAILFPDSTGESIDIGIGAIVGAPFMLSTLAFFLTGLSVIVFRKKRRTGVQMKVNNAILGRDMGFFILVYSVALGATFIQSAAAKSILAVALISAYAYYVIQTVKQDKVSHGQLEELYFTKYLNLRNCLGSIILQVIAAMGGIVFGAEIFVSNIEAVSHIFGIPVLILSLIIAPIATELPEKFNSILWISKNKDTLAMGNITGAMVFQSCIPVCIGIMATPWILDKRVLISAVLALLSAVLTLTWIRVKGKLSPLPLLAGGAFYLLFISYIMIYGLK